MIGHQTSGRTLRTPRRGGCQWFAETRQVACYYREGGFVVYPDQGLISWQTVDYQWVAFGMANARQFWRNHITFSQGGWPIDATRSHVAILRRYRRCTTTTLTGWTLMHLAAFIRTFIDPASWHTAMLKDASCSILPAVVDYGRVDVY
jgi:hypothetical protein